MKNKFAVIAVLSLTIALLTISAVARGARPVAAATKDSNQTVAAWELAGSPERAAQPQNWRLDQGAAQPLRMNSAAAIYNAAKLQFVLPSGKRLTGYRRLNESENAARIWEGFLYASEDVPADDSGEGSRGEVILTSDRINIAGVLYDSGAAYEVVSRGGNYYLVEYLHQESENCRVAVDEAASLERPDQDIVKSVFDGATVARQSIAASQDSGDRVDVMVAYTEAAASYFGGAPQTDLFVQTALATTNAVFRNSQNRVRVNLVRSTQIGYAETGSSTADLNWLKTSPQIAQLRDEKFADLVVLITDSGDACGTSQLLTGSGITAGSGLAVVKRSCAVGGSAFAHEVGHLFGADHDPSDSPVPASMHVLPFAYGKAVNGQFVTLMGFFSNAVCPDYCPRVLMFSNPSVLYNGTPTGIVGQRDNARVVEYTADAVANLRTSPRTITLLSPNTNLTWRRNMIREITWNSSNISGDVRIEISRDGGRSFQTLIETTPNTGVRAIQVTGPATRSARIRVVSISEALVTDTSVINFSIL